MDHFNRCNLRNEMVNKNLSKGMELIYRICLIDEKAVLQEF